MKSSFHDVWRRAICSRCGENTDMPSCSGERWNPQDVQYGRRDVDVPGNAVIVFSRREQLLVVDQERDMDVLVIEKERMVVVHLVLVEGLAMVGKEEEERVLHQVVALEFIDQHAQ